MRSLTNWFLRKRESSKHYRNNTDRKIPKRKSSSVTLKFTETLKRTLTKRNEWRDFICSNLQVVYWANNNSTVEINYIMINIKSYFRRNREREAKRLLLLLSMVIENNGFLESRNMRWKWKNINFKEWKDKVK